VTFRTLLFVPGDRPERMQRAVDSGADAVILDLEDSVAVARKPQARAAVAAFLAGGARAASVLVRINPLGGGLAEDDLRTLVANPPAAIVLPKCTGPDDVLALGALLPALQRTPVLPIVTETPGSLFALGGYARCRGSLLGLAWGAEDLSAAVGAATAREPDGRYTAPYEMARALALFAAHAAGVQAFDTVYPALRDDAGLAAYAGRACRDGFTGMLALHPDQVPVIHRAFAPGEDELQRAREVVAAFDAHPGAGVLSVGGRMVDAPHLAQARKVIARAPVVHGPLTRA
ncbi:MAG: hypothetical protein RL684_2966, partial [Pseudomonadota bacterium]